MDHPNNILGQIRPCNISKPYIFVSYSSRDWETVWTDVLRFQRDGYNVWLDEKNLDKTKSSWKEDALRAINSRWCRLLLFYVSASSLCSEPCLREMGETRSETTVTNHFEPVPYVAIDVEPIGDIVGFHKQVHKRLLMEVEDDREFTRQAQVLRTFVSDFFGGNNDRVRVHPRSEEGRRGDYYKDIQSSFPDETRLEQPAVIPPEPDPCAGGPGQPLAPRRRGRPPKASAGVQAAPAPQPQPDPVPPSEAEPPQASPVDLHTVKTLGNTDIKYSICTFGSGFHIGFGAPVTLEIDGRRYERKMHNATKGRVDSMKQVYADHGLTLGDVLDARYIAVDRLIRLTKLDSAQ